MLSGRHVEASVRKNIALFDGKKIYLQAESTEFAISFFQDLRSSHGLNDEMKRLAKSNVQQVLFSHPVFLVRSIGLELMIHNLLSVVLFFTLLLCYFLR